MCESPSVEYGVGHVFAERFRVVGRLGKGGMGAVYAAEDLATGAPVALKVLSAELVEDPSFVERFRREAEATARLAHPNIVRVEDFVHRPGEPALIVMERLEGESLLATVRRGPLAPARARSIALQLTEALGAAHAAGVVHRDLKPANVFLVPQGEQEQVKLLDFGIAKLKESDGYHRLTQTGVLIGTPRYASPEQVMGRKDIDAPTDIFSLGVLLYGMLSGRPPFTEKGAALLVAIQRAEPPLLEWIAPVPSSWATVVRRAMAKPPGDRYPSMEAFRAALEALGAHPVGSREPKSVPTSSTQAQSIQAQAIQPQSVQPQSVQPPSVSPSQPLTRATTTAPTAVSVPRTPSRGISAGPMTRVAESSEAPSDWADAPSQATVHGLRGAPSASHWVLGAGVVLVGAGLVALALLGGAFWYRTERHEGASASGFAERGRHLSRSTEYLPSRAALEGGAACVDWEYHDCVCRQGSIADIARCRETRFNLRVSAERHGRARCQNRIPRIVTCVEPDPTPPNLTPGSRDWRRWARLRASRLGASCAALMRRDCTCEPDSMFCRTLERDLLVAASQDSTRRRILELCRAVPDDARASCR